MDPTALDVGLRADEVIIASRPRFVFSDMVNHVVPSPARKSHFAFSNNAEPKDFVVFHQVVACQQGNPISNSRSFHTLEYKISWRFSRAHAL